MNSKRKNTNSKVILYSTIAFKCSFKRFLVNKQKIWLRFGITNLIDKHLRLKIPYTHNTNFWPQIIILCNHQIKSESKININNQWAAIIFVLYIFKLYSFAYTRPHIYICIKFVIFYVGIILCLLGFTKTDNWIFLCIRIKNKDKICP